MKHGAKIGENLYFSAYPITKASWPELNKLALAAYAYYGEALAYSFMAEAMEKELDGVVEALACLTESQKKQYHPGGAVALREVFNQFDDMMDSRFSDERSCYLVAFSAEPLAPTFSFKRDAAKIEMMMAILSSPRLDYTIHLGIQRSLLYRLQGNPLHSKLSMCLHGAGAQFIREHHPDKQFMVTSPLPKMHEIFRGTLAPSAQLRISKYRLEPLRQCLNLSPGPSRFCDFGLDILKDDCHFATPLTALLPFCRPERAVLDEEKETAVAGESNHHEWKRRRSTCSRFGDYILMGLVFFATRMPQVVAALGSAKEEDVVEFKRD